MKKREIEEVERKIFIEKKIKEYKEQNPNNEVDIMYIYRMINFEKEIELGRDDIDYLLDAKLIPFEELDQIMYAYDHGKLKIDENTLLTNLMNKYKIPESTLIKRIVDIHMINTYYKNLKRKTKKK